MEQEKLRENILKNFDKKQRQILFWYNVDDEYESKLKAIDLGEIKIHELTKNNNLLTKKLLERDDVNSSYLVYAKFSKPTPQENWFADILFYSKEFSVDEVANLCAEFELYDIDSKNLFTKHKRFFDNQERKNKFKKCLLNDKTPANIYLAMFATIVNCKFVDFYKILQMYIINTVLNNKDVDKEFSNYDLTDKFWEIVNKQFGYNNKRDANLLLATIMLKNLKQKLSSTNFPDSYNKYECDSILANESNLFLESWYTNSELKEDYKKLSNIISNDILKIKENIKVWTDIINCEPDFQTFEVFDTSLIEYLISSFDTLKCETKKIIDNRRNTIFYEKYENVYEAIYWAIELNNLIKFNAIPDKRPQDFIKEYSNTYYRIDKAYRKFYYYYQNAEYKVLDKIKEIVEKAYVNNYLDTLSSKFSKSISELAPNWKISDVPMQKDFYLYKIKPLKNRIVVIISDALRYEVAQELMEKLQQNQSIHADMKLEHMLGSIPAITKFGMAALLPHSELYLNDKQDILADGLSTKMENRETVLKAKNEKSKVLYFSNFDDYSVLKLREIFKDTEVVYVYHNKIDKAGESDEKGIFNAANRAIDELNDKIELLIKNVTSKVIVTSDHGFLYQYSDLEENNKIAINNAPVIEKSKRYILDKLPFETTGVMNFNMNYLFKNSEVFVSLPCNINRFKTQGGGINYVHGGASLQEIVIPVLTINKNQNQDKPNKVNIVLSNYSNKRITNNTFTLSFLQQEKVDNVKYLPRKVSISMWDEKNNKQISNEICIDANIESDEMEDRIFKNKTFILKNYDFDKMQDYHLIIKDVDEVGEPYSKTAFKIDIFMKNDF